jgi:ABC-2 type transport system ATP-binding protein
MSAVAAEDRIALRRLVKTFRSPDGPVRAVRGVDVSVARGETVALLGPNGAGKSTTLDMLLGLSRPDDGSVTIFGKSPRQAVDAGAVGAMLQTGSLIRDLSVRELVAMMASLYPEPLLVDDVLELAGVERLARARTQGLSGGETQKVRLALALVSDPELLVLTSPQRGSTWRGGDPSGRRCARLPPTARRWCSPPTTSRRPTPTPIASC